ncbi:Ig-like domain-containing protein [Streptomyces griseomycini]|uniref:Ig-like domain-containing protein n=1 Tax=Streptomyces griseomycini TaxID=66895 RepID=UPI001875AE0A
MSRTDLPRPEHRPGTRPHPTSTHRQTPTHPTTWQRHPKVASVDPSTGALTALRPGTVTVSVTSGGVTGSAQVVVR